MFKLFKSKIFLPATKSVTDSLMSASQNCSEDYEQHM